MKLFLPKYSYSSPRDLVIKMFEITTFVARSVLQKMCEMVGDPDLAESSTDAHSIICLSAQMAFEVTNSYI